MTTPPPPPEQGQAPKKENVFTRKLGPLPMWVWLVIVGALILVWVFWSQHKSSKQSAQGQDQAPSGFGTFLSPAVIFRGGGHRPPHTRHHGKRGDHDDEDDEDRRHKHHHDRMREERTPGGSNRPGQDTSVPVGIDRRGKRGEPVPGFLVDFKTSDRGQTPSLQDVANNYDTSPEAIIQEAEGRGYPSSVAWKRYVSRHDWASPLPPATQFQILAHPE